MSIKRPRAHPAVDKNTLRRFPVANGISHQYRSTAPLKARRLPALAYAGVTILVWAPVVFVIARWLYP
jgi:hypothetical protein